MGRAEAGEVLLVRRNTSVGRSIAALRIDSQVGAGRGRGKVSAEPGPPSPGAGGTPYSRPGPSFCGGMARRSKVRPAVARGVELCCKNRLIFVEGSSGLMGVANVGPMTQNNDPNLDPAGTTQHFRRFVDENPNAEEPDRRPIMPLVLAAVGVVLAIAIIVALVMAFT